MRYSDDIIEEVRQKNDIVDVVSQYVKLTRKGSSYFGLCPFHNEKTPSFSVTPGKQMYYCFGCGAGFCRAFGILERFLLPPWFGRLCPAPDFSKSFFLFLFSLSRSLLLSLDVLVSSGVNTASLSFLPPPFLWPPRLFPPKPPLLPSGLPFPPCCGLPWPPCCGRPPWPLIGRPFPSP